MEQQLMRKWWKESVVYTLYIRSFKDTNNDGVGDLRGVLEGLGHLQELGVDVIWLSPFHPSPQEDWGYDIQDYCSVSQEMGVMNDIETLISEANKRGIRIIMDLVVNHSSIAHPWFQQSARSKDNPYRDYYYWRSGKPEGGPPNNWPNSFSGLPGSAWSYNESTDDYYLHLFTPGQPDLNWENPKVREEIFKIAKFWIDKGVSGYRLDASQFYSKRTDFPDMPPGTHSDMDTMLEYTTMGPRFHEFLKLLREAIGPEPMLVGECYGPSPETSRDIVGYDREELNIILTGDAHYVDSDTEDCFKRGELNAASFRRVYGRWHKGLYGFGWNAPWLSNQDMTRAVSRFQADDQYREKIAKLVASLLLTQWGTPFIYQGDEIGMTNCQWRPDEYIDIFVANRYKEQMALGRPEADVIAEINYRGRLNPRTPVHWNSGKNAGFSDADQLWIKVNPNYKEINIADSKNTLDSVFYFYKELIAFRKKSRTLIYGDYREIDSDNLNVYSYLRFLEGENENYFVALNVSQREATCITEDVITDQSTPLFLNHQNPPILKNGCLHLRPFESVVYRV